MININFDFLNNKRRKLILTKLDTTTLKNNIIFNITLLQKTGYNYFTSTLVMNNLNKDIGWPNVRDKEQMEDFNILFNSISNQYQSYVGVRNAFSFLPKKEHTSYFLTQTLQNYN